MNAAATSVNVIGEREILEARERAEEAHREAEQAWQAVECATRLATQAEEAATYWAAMAHRVSCQRGFRREV